MNRSYHAIRRPVRRPGADTNLLITLLSFALSVSLTRLFLELSGYPQLGGGSLHIAHVLWGGLLLFVAALLPLIFANRWVYPLVSVLAGLGVGLFIDEVGKFITQTNDYFYPPAAPIIYAFFLICVLVYLRINRQPIRQGRSELYITLEMMEDVLDRDLDAHEREEIVMRLNYVIAQKDQSDLARLAGELLDYFKDEHIYIAPTPPDYMKKLEGRLQRLEDRYLDRKRFCTVLALGLTAMGLFAASTSTSVLITSLPNTYLQATSTSGMPMSRYVGFFWYTGLQVVQGIIGLALLAAAARLIRGGERRGLDYALYALLIYLTMVDLLLFYYYQFSTIITAIVQFTLLLGVLYYRRRYIQGSPIEGEPES